MRDLRRLVCASAAVLEVPERGDLARAPVAAADQLVGLALEGVPAPAAAAARAVLARQRDRASIDVLPTGCEPDLPVRGQPPRECDRNVVWIARDFAKSGIGSQARDLSCVVVEVDRHATRALEPRGRHLRQIGWPQAAGVRVLSAQEREPIPDRAHLFEIGEVPTRDVHVGDHERAGETLSCTNDLSERDCSRRCDEALCDEWFWKERLPCWNWGYGG